MVNDKEKSLVELLGEVASPVRSAITFSTSANGTLEISDLRISFEA